jgi:hypothetical protein
METYCAQENKKCSILFVIVLSLFEKFGVMICNNIRHHNYLKNIGGTDCTPDCFIAS